jgi:hypothetical protein
MKRSVDDDGTNKKGKFQSGDAHPARRFLNQGASSSNDNSFSILQASVLESLMSDMTVITIAAHEPCLEPRPAQDKTRKLEMRSGSFGSALNSLQRAYSKLLHEAFENEASPKVSANVRNLADAVAWKLQANCSHEDAEEGKRLMHQMLAHLQVEFKWEKISTILEAAAEVARTEKSNAYRDAKACQDQLRDIRRKTD